MVTLNCLTLSQLSYLGDGLADLTQCLYLDVYDRSYMKEMLHHPGIEPGSRRWQRRILPLDQ